MSRKKAQAAALTTVVMMVGLLTAYSINHEHTRAHISESYGCETEVDYLVLEESHAGFISLMETSTYNCPNGEDLEKVEEAQNMVTATSYTQMPLYFILSTMVSILFVRTVF